MTKISQKKEQRGRGLNIQRLQMRCNTFSHQRCVCIDCCDLKLGIKPISLVTIVFLWGITDSMALLVFDMASPLFLPTFRRFFYVFSFGKYI